MFWICAFVTSDNGSILLLVQFLAGPESPDVEPLCGLHCILTFWYTKLDQNPGSLCKLSRALRVPYVFAFMMSMQPLKF